jgi:hypothetical protein
MRVGVTLLHTIILEASFESSQLSAKPFTILTQYNKEKLQITVRLKHAVI